MGFVVVVLILALAALHHDTWWWGDAEPLVFGFIPIGLAWHAGISIAAGVVWWIAVTFCWPKHLTELDESEESSS